MLKKLRRRFTGAAMAAIFAVIFVLFCGINAWNFGNITVQQDNTLNRLMTEEKRPPFEKNEPFSPEVSYMFRYFSVHCDSGGKVVEINRDHIATVSDSDAEALANAVINKGSARGYINGYRYLSANKDGGKTVLFLNSEKELRSAVSLLKITATIATVSLAVIFVLVVLFSKRAIAPYVKNIEAQKQFITNASHELKTPITAIATSAEVLASEDGENEWVKNVKFQTAKLSKLVTNLITLSRLDEENPFPQRSEFSLSDALWETGDSFVSVAKAKGLDFSQEIEDGLLLTGDRAAIQQTVSILLDNAVKYSPENGKIVLKASRGPKKAEITVTNDADPTSTADVTKLFDRFYRGTGGAEGTGIGLSIAKAATEAHGGKISAEKNGNKIIFKIKF